MAERSLANIVWRGLQALALALLLVCVWVFVAPWFGDCGALSQRARGDLNALGATLRIFAVNCGRLPTDEEGLAALVTRPASVPPERWQRLLYRLPRDPWDRDYRYQAISREGMTAMRIFSLGEDPANPEDDLEAIVSP